MLNRETFSFSLYFFGYAEKTRCFTTNRRKETIYLYLHSSFYRLGFHFSVFTVRWFVCWLLNWDILQQKHLLSLWLLLRVCYSTAIYSFWIFNFIITYPWALSNKWSNSSQLNNRQKHQKKNDCLLYISTVHKRLNKNHQISK